MKKWWVVLMVFVLIGTFLVSAEDYCQTLKDVIEANNEQKCGDANYKAFADIDKDGVLTLVDMILVDTNSADQQWCLDRMNDNTNPCENGAIVYGGESSNNYNTVTGAGGTDVSGGTGASGGNSNPGGSGEKVPAQINNQQTESPDTFTAGGVQLKKPTPNLILLWISALIIIIVIMICLYFLIKHLIEIRKTKP